jgi:hypothetical protein
LYEREVRKDIDKAERLESNGVMEEVTQEMEEMELDDDRIPLEDDEAARAADEEEFGKDVSITQTVREIQLEDQIASSDEAAEKQLERKAWSESKRRGVRAMCRISWRATNSSESRLRRLLDANFPPLARHASLGGIESSVFKTVAYYSLRQQYFSS